MDCNAQLYMYLPALSVGDKVPVKILYDPSFLATSCNAIDWIGKYLEVAASTMRKGRQKIFFRLLDT